MHDLQLGRLKHFLPAIASRQHEILLDSPAITKSRVGVNFGFIIVINFCSRFTFANVSKEQQELMGKEIENNAG